jgi:hypothetical protein
MMLLGSVFFVLLMACANVANLFKTVCIRVSPSAASWPKTA